MDIIAAYREVGSLHGATEMCATTPKTVKRVKKTHGRISAKRLLPAASAAGYAVSPRNFRQAGR